MRWRKDPVLPTSLLQPLADRPFRHDQRSRGGAMVPSLLGQLRARNRRHWRGSLVGLLLDVGIPDRTAHLRPYLRTHARPMHLDISSTMPYPHLHAVG